MTTTQSDPLAVAVGERIHAEMWRQRVTTAALGRAIGVSQSTASKKVRGMVPMTVTELLAAARLLDVEPGDLLTLPRLDSNQQPSGYTSPQVNAAA